MTALYSSGITVIIAMSDGGVDALLDFWGSPAIDSSPQIGSRFRSTRAIPSMYRSVIRRNWNGSVPRSGRARSACDPPIRQHHFPGVRSALPRKPARRFRFARSENGPRRSGRPFHRVRPVHRSRLNIEIARRLRSSHTVTALESSGRSPSIPRFNSVSGFDPTKLCVVSSIWASGVPRNPSTMPSPANIGLREASRCQTRH